MEKQKQNIKKNIITIRDFKWLVVNKKKSFQIMN